MPRGSRATPEYQSWLCADDVQRRRNRRLHASGKHGSKVAEKPAEIRPRTSGGPGQAASDMLQATATALHLRHARGIIMIDQRGTGASQPSLTCDSASALEIDDNRLNDPEFAPATSVEERLSDCMMDWHEHGVDLNAFDTRSAALDLMASRRGFGIRQWNLHGTSYGARVVQDAMRVDPEGIRAVVMNSPQALSPHFDRDFAENRARLFAQLFSDCADDAYCSDEFGDLEAHLERIRLHLSDEGMEIRSNVTISGCQDWGRERTGGF